MNIGLATIADQDVIDKAWLEQPVDRLKLKYECLRVFMTRCGHPSRYDDPV